ncbi:MAG: Na+/H+ antiporter subunit E [Halieaceae bacterium]|jgi:multicomponent Na+:H+ antiporter subunit E|nr:Na+/H+ antiporter subunit E [Halieaceae bacterium]
MTVAANSYDNPGGGKALRHPLARPGQWLARLGVFGLLWWLLSAGDSGSWIVGAPAVLLATWASVSLATELPLRVSLSGLARYLLFFVVESIRGGVDVARRVLLPGRPVDPYFFHYRTAIDGGLPRSLLLYTVSLLPGTLAVDSEDDPLTVHALSRDMAALQSIRACERRVAAVFNRSLEKAGSQP